jgi:cell division septum initiation protein DivIVA
VGKAQDKLLEKQRKLQDNLTEAQQRLNIAQMQARSSGTTEGVQAVETVIGLLMRRRRSISAITRSHGAAQRQRKQASDLQQKVSELQQQMMVLAAQMQATVTAEEQAARGKYLAVDQKLLRPKMSNIVVRRVGVVFR